MTRTSLPIRLSIRWLLALVVLGAILPGVAANEQDREEKYRDVIATFLWRFASYVTWPDGSFADANAPFVIGVIGNDDLARVVENQVRTETARKRKFKVERIRGIDFRTPTQVNRFRDRIQRCHIVFISQAQRARMPQILEVLRDRRILTVSDTRGFAVNGGMIEFAVVEEKVTLEIHRTPVQRAGLRLSSQLLKAAARTYPERR